MRLPAPPPFDAVNHHAHTRLTTRNICMPLEEAPALRSEHSKDDKLFFTLASGGFARILGMDPTVSRTRGSCCPRPGNVWVSTSFHAAREAEGRGLGSLCSICAPCFPFLRRTLIFSDKLGHLQPKQTTFRDWPT